MISIIGFFLYPPALSLLKSKEGTKKMKELLLLRIFICRSGSPLDHASNPATLKRFDIAKRSGAIGISTLQSAGRFAEAVPIWITQVIQ
jgi:hypothetical protein